MRKGLFAAMLLCPLAFAVPAAAQSKVNIEQNFADSLSTLLSAHNASKTQPLVIKRIAYFDTAGKQVESYLKAPVAVRPLATVSISIPTDDVRGGGPISWSTWPRQARSPSP